MMVGGPDVAPSGPGGTLTLLDKPTADMDLLRTLVLVLISWDVLGTLVELVFLLWVDTRRSSPW